MKHAWWNDYIGIPYLEGGRDRDGIDCWGLVRLIYKHEFNHDLPSLIGDYNVESSKADIQELMARQMENWVSIDQPLVGDVVLFKPINRDPHIGVVLDSGRFLHIIEGAGSVIERLSSIRWNKRIVGYYRYAPNKLGITVSAAAHPLKTERVEIVTNPGCTVEQLIEKVRLRQQIAGAIPMDAVVWVNGRQIEPAMWAHVIPAEGSRVEIRAVAKSGQTGRMIGMLAIMVVAMFIAPHAAPGIVSALGVTEAVATSLAYSAITFAGSLLLNAIFPIRPTGQDPGSPQQQYLLQGSQNSITPYGAIPVVLGRMRYAPPLAGKPLMETSATESHMRLALLWGYGELQISDIRIGETPLAEFDEVEIETVEGTSGEDMDRFNSIYGKDIEQIAPNIELVCIEKSVISAIRSGDVVTVTANNHGYSTGWNAKLDGEDGLNGTLTVTGANTFTVPMTGTRIGANLTPNPVAFSNYTGGAGWTFPTDEFGAPLGATHTGSIGASALTYNGLNAVAGKTYRLKVNTGGAFGGQFFAYCGGQQIAGTEFTAAGDRTITVVAPAAGPIGIYAEYSTTGTVNSLEVRQIYQVGDTDGPLVGVTTALGSPWIENVVNEEVESLSVSIHFPEGLRQVVLEGGNAGDSSPAAFRALLQTRQLDSFTLEPITPWGDVDRRITAKSFNLPSAFYNIDNDEALEEVYRWYVFTIDEHGKIVMRAGAMTNNVSGNPTGNLLTRLQQDNFGLNATFTRLPPAVDGEEPLWSVCVKGNVIFDTIDQRDADVTGCGLTTVGRKVTIASGTISRAEAETIKLGNTGERYSIHKDAFTYTVKIDVSRGVHEVRLRRTNSDRSDFQFPSSGNDGTRYHRAFLQYVTGYSNRRPITPPQPMSMSAIRVKATNQLNGNTDAFVGTAISVCLDWDTTTQTWIKRPTRNPASLYRHVLQHPANAKRVPNSMLDLPAIQAFHDFCRVNRFMFDAVIMSQRSLWDVLADICAAGRASHTRRDGKWSVIIDRPNNTIAQMFTPHNSWGFSGVRALPQQPHAFRVQFTNAEKGYQPDERLVYNDGYSSANATLIEGLQLPGVTTPTAVFKHARFHMAQLKLRPETYTFNTDWEHIICTRGDRVKVNHFVPMWGLGSGRIKARIDSTHIQLDEKVPMDADVNYGIRIRLETGVSITRQIVPAVVDGYYDTLELTTSVTVDQAKLGLLFAFGKLNEESVDLLVQSIEPGEDLSAQITCVDYAPAVFDSDSEVIPAWDSQITLPPVIHEARITQKPVITNMISNESVMARLPSGAFDYGIRISWRNPGNLLKRVTHVQCEIDFVNAKKVWQDVQMIDLRKRSATFMGLKQSREYVIRLRYVDRDGRAGPWVYSEEHAVVGKTTPPRQVSGFTATPDGLRIELEWRRNPEIDVIHYEIRTSDSGWGDDNYLRRIAGTSTVVDPGPVGGTRTWYIRARDAGGLYSLVSSSYQFFYAPPAAPTGLTAMIFDTINTIATVNFDWTDALPAFGVDYYECVLTFPNATTRTFKRRTSDLTVPMNWIGTSTLAIKTVDRRGNKSEAAASINVTKAVPNQVGVITQTVETTGIRLNWPNNVKTTLPIAGYEVRTSDSGWGDDNFFYRGAISAVWVPRSTLVVGTNTWYVRAFDTDGRYSATSRSSAYAKNGPAMPTGLTHAFTDTSTTDAFVKLNWNDVTPVFGLNHYEVSLTTPAGTRTIQTRASEWLTRADWIGAATLKVKAVDRTSAITAEATYTFTKVAPNTVGVITKTVKKDRITLDWANLSKTSLPIAGYEVRTVDSGWGTSTGIAFKGQASVCRLVMVPGVNTYYVRAYDTDGNYSTASATVSHTYDLPSNVTTVTAVRSGRDIIATATGGATNLDFSHYEWRIKRGVSTGDVWTTGYDVALTTKANKLTWRPTLMGTYRIAVRRVDRDENVSAASALVNITLAQIAAP